MIIGVLKNNRFSASTAKGKGTQLAADTDSEEEEEDDDEIQIIDQHIGWAYVGSHNFTPSAWGTLSGSSFNPILNVSRIAVILGCICTPSLNRLAKSSTCSFRSPITKWVLSSRSRMKRKQTTFRALRGHRRNTVLAISPG